MKFGLLFIIFLFNVFLNYCINVGRDDMCIRGSYEFMGLEGMFMLGSYCLVDLRFKKILKSWSSFNVIKEKCKIFKIFV